MPRRPGFTTSLMGRQWTQVLGIWIPGLLQFRIQESFPSGGEIRWRRLSAGFPWYVQGSFQPTESGFFTFVLSDLYVSLELFKDGVPTSSHPFFVEQVFP